MLKALLKGIDQQRRETAKTRMMNNAELIADEHEMYRQIFQKIVAEVASYAKTHNIIVVRRIDAPEPTEPTEATTATPRRATEADRPTDFVRDLPTAATQPGPSPPSASLGIRR